MELSRQEHMIKLLEESNERSQMLRVKQEEKIGRMEEEIARLKQTMYVCVWYYIFILVFTLRSIEPQKVAPSHTTELFALIPCF